MPRDVFFHPQAWDVQNHASGPVDATALAIGALVLLFGLVEVVLLVGSAFAVGARRQVRDLGLVAANGGAAGDVRTVLLAQGLVLGVGASVLGALMGLLAFHLGVPMYEVMAHRRVWAQDIDWLSVTGLTLLGATTGLIAALAPAWSISRMSVVDALSGRFAVDEKELRTHRPAVAIALLGLVVLVASGWWTAAEFAERADTSTYDVGYEVPPSPIPLVVGAVGLLLLIGGVTWVAPHVVRRVASGSRFLSVSGRFALREASRHRFRTAASAVTLMITVAGMLFAGFAVQAASAQVARDTSSFGPRWMSVWLGPEGPDPAADAQRVNSVVDAIHDQLGDAQTLVSYLPSLPDKPDYVPFLGTGDAPDPGVHVVDQDALVQLVEADGDILDVFAHGGIVTTSPDAVQDGRVHVAVDPPGKKHDETWNVAAIYAEPTELGSGLDMPGSWMSEATAADLGFVATPTTVTVVADRDITVEGSDALAVQGITGSSVVRELERVGLVRFAALGAARPPSSSWSASPSPWHPPKAGPTRPPWPPSAPARGNADASEQCTACSSVSSGPCSAPSSASLPARHSCRSTAHPEHPSRGCSCSDSCSSHPSPGSPVGWPPPPGSPWSAAPTDRSDHVSSPRCDTSCRGWSWRCVARR